MGVFRVLGVLGYRWFETLFEAGLTSHIASSASKNKRRGGRKVSALSPSYYLY
jgi:hypothetical protein